ncbi:MAG TPA: hypothetical protein VF720_03175 [Candidatus Eisenbacteria bacterium]
MTDGPAPSAGEPTHKDTDPVPPVSSGAFWKTIKDKYDRHENHHGVFDSHSWKLIVGLSVSAVLSKAHKITLGWEHKSVKGGSVTVVMPYDNKLNVGAVCNYIIMDKSETTLGNKSEWILGFKFAKVNGKKQKFEGANKLKVSEIEQAKKTVDLQLHVMALEKLMAAELERDIKNLEEEHSKAEEIMKKAEATYTQMEVQMKEWTFKSNYLKSDIPKAQWECDSAEAKYSATWKSLSDAAHEITADGGVDMVAGAEAKFIGKSLIQLGASLTNAG